MGWTVKGDFGDYTFADDITEEEALQYIEKVDKPAEWSQTTDLGRLGELTSIQAGRTVAGGARLLGDALSPIIGDNVLSQEARGFEKYAKERSQELAVPNQSIWQQGVESGLTSVPQVLPWVVGGSVIGATRGAAALAKGIPEAIAKSFAAGAGIATTGMGAQTGLSRYGDLREKGFDVGVSALAATWDGVVEKFTEYLPVKDLLNVTAPAGKWLYGFLTKELGGELAATTLQDLSAKLTDRPDMTLGDFARDLAVTAIATPIGAGVQMGVMAPINLGIGAALTPQQPIVAPPAPPPAEGKSIVVGRTGEPEGLFYSSAIGENAIALPKEGSRVTQFTDPRVSERADDAPLARLVTDGTITLSAPVRTFAEMSQGRWADPVRAADLLGAIQLKNDGVEIAHFRNPETGTTISLDLRKFDPNRAYKDLLAGTVPSGGKQIPLPQPVDPGDAQLKALETKVPVAPPTEPLAPPVPEAKPLHTTIKKTKTGKGVTVNYSSDVQQRLFRIGEAKSRKGFIPPYLLAETLDLASDLGLPYDTVSNLTVLYRNEVRGLAYNATVDEVQAPEISDDLINQAAPQGHNEVALPAGTVQLAAGLTPTPYTQRAVAQLKGWIRVFAPQMRIVVIAVGPSGFARPSGRADGAIYITLPPEGGTPIYQMFSLAHEFGHALTLHLLWRPEHRATLGRLKTEWEALKAKAPTMTVGQFMNEWASPWKIQRWGAQGSVKGIALSAPATELFKAQDAKTYTGYTLSFPEYAAEQVSRYVGKNDSISFAEDRTWFEEIVSKLREFFDRVVSKLKVQPEFERWLDSLTESALLENMAAEELAVAPEVTGTDAEGFADERDVRAGINLSRLSNLLGPQLYGDMSTMTRVTLKELYQNAFDALKDAISQGAMSEGEIKIWVDRDKRQITVQDNGIGMTPDIIQNAFLTLAGTEKISGRSSGGLGVAKMLFLFGSDALELETVRDGVKSTLKTTGAELLAAANDPTKSPKLRTEPTDEPSGTTVKVVIPAKYVDAQGNDQEISFISKWSAIVELEQSPLFENVKVRVGEPEESGERERWMTTAEVGVGFPIDKFSPVATVRFPWGRAVVLASKKEESVSGQNVSVLSEGLFQFKRSIKKKLGDAWSPQVPRQFYINVEPDVKADHPQYPFALNRQNFSPSLAPVFEKLLQYVQLLYSNAVDEEEVHTFGTLTAIRSDGSEEVIELSPPRAAPGTTLRVDLGDNLEVIEGRIYRNGELLPEIDPQHMQDLKQDLNQYEIDMGTQIAKFESGQAMLIHDNLDLVATDLAGVELRKPLIQAAIEALGGNRELVFEYFRSVMKVFQRLRDTVAATFPEFEDSQVLDVNLSNVPVGVSLDNEYFGVNIRVPVTAMFLNPGFSRGAREQAPARMVSTMVHEIVHHLDRNHSDTSFIPRLQYVLTGLAVQTTALADAVAGMQEALTKYKDVFDFFYKEIGDGNTKNRGVKLAGASDPVDYKSLSERAQRRRDERSGVKERSGVYYRLGDSDRNAAGSEELGGAQGEDVGGDDVGFADTGEKLDLLPLSQRWGAARFIRSALYTFQINQLAKSFPGVSWITTIRDVFRAMANYKNKLMEEPNLRIKEYYHLPVDTTEAVGVALREEFQNEVHWFDLKTNPDGSHEFVVSGVTLAMAKAKGLSEEAVEFMRRIKNDFMKMLDETERVLLEGLQAHFAESPDLLMAKEQELREQFAGYRSKPYLPATRFGKYAVTVRAGADVDIEGMKFKKGEVMSFERFDWKHQQQERVRALRALFPNHAVATSIIPDAVQAYSQLPFELVNSLVETLGERGLGLTPEQLEILREVSYEGTKTGRFAKYLSQKVKGTAGASKDIRRVYATYMWKMSNALSKLKYGWQLNRVLGDMRNTLTEMHKSGLSTDPLDLIYQRLVEQKDYVLQPQHEYQALRGAVSLWYLWGVPKTAIMNFTSTPILTYPYLWARFGAPKSLGTLMKSMKWAVQAWRDPKQFEENHPELMGVLNRGLADGVRDQSFAAMLAGASDANSLEMLLPNFDFARAQRLGDFGKKAMWRTIDAGMLPFRVVEKFNRDIALLATYQLNREAGKGVEESYAEAVAAVDATQNDYSSWNRSQLLQGPKSVALLFFSFIQNMSYLMYGGDKSWWRALMMMVMLGGMLGLPGLENFLDVIDWAARKLLGRHVDLRQDAREYVAMMGANPDIVMHGLSRATPYDLSASIGAGRIIPGTEAIFGVGEFEQRFVAASGEIGGPVGALAVNVIRALADNNPNAWSMMDSLLPPALRNVQRGIEMIGYDAIRNRRGETVVPDPELSEIVGQFLGANPLRKATTMEQQRHSYAASQYYSMRRTYLMGRLYMARKAGDSDAFISARERIAEYNQKVPHRDLRISPDDIRRSLRTRARTSRLKEQGKPLSRRDRGLYSEIAQGYPD